jgi:hypothetical protein
VYLGVGSAPKERRCHSAGQRHQRIIAQQHNFIFRSGRIGTATQCGSNSLRKVRLGITPNWLASVLELTSPQSPLKVPQFVSYRTRLIKVQSRRSRSRGLGSPKVSSCIALRQAVRFRKVSKGFSA